MGANVRVTLTSKDNPKIKLARSLRQRSQRQATGLFIAEGIRHVGEAVEAAQAGRLSVEAIFFSDDLLRSEFALNLIDQQEQAGLPCYALPGKLFTSLADKENPQGILALVRSHSAQLAELTPDSFPWGVALIAPQDPGNIGTILRTIDAVGASGLILVDSSADPHHPAAVRASMGAIFWHPVVSAPFHDFIVWAESKRYSVYGTSAHGSRDYREIEKYEDPLVLLMGSEREGLTDEQAASCHELIRLPMQGRATSLNLAVAAGVILYDIYTKRESGDLKR
jgi:RNA methyltransferase, TrmH family